MGPSGLEARIKFLVRKEGDTWEQSAWGPGGISAAGGFKGVSET